MTARLLRDAPGYQTFVASLMRVFISVSAIAMPTSAFAQDGIGHLADFWSGFNCLPSTFDHTIAMLLVGLFSFRLGGRAVWLLPGAFIVIMFLGSRIGVAGALPFIGSGASLSLVLFGAIVAFNIKIPVNATMSFAGVFALLHGQMLGEEMNGNFGGVAYLGGFAAATVLLDAVGAALAWAIAGIDDGWGPIDARTGFSTSATAGFGVGAAVF
ncbi:hydrogenase/urease accessory protein [Rhizobium leguminosarum bv. trifolii WSM597]|uniref:Hydrogenase/urease accessory protein n=1 Tax=Rhizobium leguminosarum bv. trifolii WSM597 TaxID=754764 RepID=I9NMT9_RHILT|nr:HupE/UreJ family protein [Rhizobium leguminosarum]EJB08167.1 hydrogenase/urease accessory protein [Rhizobium leguminosarum bv. trifolii WSM597]